MRLDSSAFWQDPDNRLDGVGLPRNLPAVRGGLIEIPVTVYERADRPAFLSARFAPVTTVRKFDPNWFVDESEMRRAIDAAIAADLPVLVVFLHSFSFMAEPADGKPRPDDHAAPLFRALLEAVASRKLTVVNMRDLAAERPPNLPTVRDAVPQVPMTVGFTRYVGRRAKHSPRGSLGLGAASLGLCAGAVLAARRRRNRRARSVS